MNIPLVLLPPSWGKVGMGGRGKEHLTMPGVPFSPPPSPSPIQGEGMEEGKSFLEIA
jgi:hypothetical protein